MKFKTTLVSHVVQQVSEQAPQFSARMAFSGMAAAAAMVYTARAMAAANFSKESTHV